MPAREHVASASVRVGGSPLAPENMDSVERIEVRLFAGLPDMATIRLADPEGRHVSDPPFDIGDEVEIRLGALDAPAPAPVFTGEIVAFEPEFTSAAALLCVRAYDASHRMHRNRRSATYQDMTLGDVVRRIAGENGLPVGELDPTPTVHPFLQQSMETDLDFVSRLAALEHREFGVDGGAAFLRDARRNGAPGTVPTLAWRRNVTSFKPRLTAAQQHDTVRVASYDPASRAAVVGEASRPAGLAPAAADARDRGRRFGRSELLVADRIATTAEEAGVLAQNTLDRLAGGSFEADGVMHGNPAVKAGGRLRLEGFGRFDGEHRVSTVTHVYGQGDFRTRFAISGPNPRTLIDVMRPKAERDWAAGLVIGLVSNNQDPERLGRVRVKFPALADDMESTWARIALAGAGPEAGMAFLPQIGDEVVVAFEHGDARRPVVLGALHNTLDPPHARMAGNRDGGSLVVYGRKDAEIDLKEQLVIAARDRMVVTVASGARAPGDHRVEASNSIEVEAGSTVTISGAGAVTIKSSAGINVEAAGPLSLKGATVDIQASATVNVKGSLINLG